jgi:nitroreductase
MEICEAIEKRRTIRKYQGPATEEQLKRILLEGVKAPSAGNRQSWEFVIVDDPALIEKVSEVKYVLMRGKPRGEEAPAAQEKVAQAQKDSFANASLVLVYSKPGAAEAATAWVCIENMLLAATGEGLGTRIGMFWGDSVKEIDKLVNAPEDLALAAAITVGIPAEEPGPRSLRPDDSWLHRNSF